MNDLMPSPKKRIQKISRWVRVGCVFLITVISCVLLYFLFFLWAGAGDGIIVGDSGIGFRMGPGVYTGSNPTVPFADFSTGVKILMTIGLSFYSGCFVKALYHLYKLFYYYAKGSIFTTQANSQIKQIGIVGCIIAVFMLPNILGGHINVSLIVKGGIDLSGISSGDLTGAIVRMSYYLIFSATVICFSWIMEKGREIREDQELTI